MSGEPTLEQCIRKHLPPVRRVLLHIALLLAVAYTLGPWLGPMLFGFIDTQSTWGRGQSYEVGNVFNWGTLFLIIELLAYTAWISKQGRKGYDEFQMLQWRKALEGETEEKP